MCISQRPVRPKEASDAPQVENVPCTGWNEISLTEYTSAWSLTVVDESLRWHLNEKLFLCVEFQLDLTRQARSGRSVRGVLFIDVLDRHAAFDTADGESAILRGGETRDYACLPFQRRNDRLHAGPQLYIFTTDVEVGARTL